ncbi:hypothetical protein [Pseudoroseicyclus aestuarii]|uniref:Uncharacterized protein n=1 Tax=Pseudoroseicyclus aestuarii TaxID=1795041 RepID=A0A318SV68_9RHOB|nr:hypothetical protein [Pseudoroseicyclus aestuarii]PYE84249.1 hypothetical protein DFP88_10244 [Pseudoroseicyclus aestuarii]
MALYRPRQMAPSGTCRIAGQPLKLYRIALEGAPLPDLAAARALAEARLPREIEEEGGAEGPGLLLLHAGEGGVWLLLMWWAHGDILCRRLLRAETPAGPFVPHDSRALMACVWELAVIDHERRAWIRHMMTARPDPDGWAADFLEGLH